ncbi:MAG: lytic transglycosylase domain-containing protein [Ferrovum sp.]|nr:lytic transglycosylase domain-containing protein [Ferrovum sp.]NDU87347.1 lytic transglycosylase domain-containing protein [Ferrovum sp.]
MRQFHSILALLCGLTLLIIVTTLPAEEWLPPDDSGAAPQPHAATALTDEELLRAHQAWQQHDQKTLQSIADQAQGPLSDYPRYWALKERLSQGNVFVIPEVQAFMRDFPNSPLTPLLRQQWLDSLGQNENWRTFEAQLTASDMKLPTLACYHWHAELLQGKQDFIEGALAYWKAHGRWSAACDPVFRQLLAIHALTPEDLWNAMRHALGQNRLREVHYINSFFPPFQGLDEDALSLASGRPQKYLEDAPPIDASATRSRRELWLYALLRLASRNPDEAAGYWADLAPNMNPQDRAYGWEQLAYRGAVNFSEHTLDWFQQDTSPLENDELRAWKIRAALRQKNWDVVLDVMAQLSPAEAAKPVWKYWKAQALNATQHPIEARHLLGEIAQTPGYYGLLAGEELNIPWKLTPSPPALDEATLASVRTLLSRPLRLLRLDLVTEARGEWVALEPSLDSRQHLAAAQIASQLGWYDRSIHSAEHTDLVDPALLFPLPYATLIHSCAARYGVSEPWILAVIRQESRFFVTARSRTGALGLMQLMPATARWSARRIGIKNYHAEDANVAETNIPLGTYYLGHLNQLLGNPILAVMGYNAGPLRAQTWASSGIGDPRIFVENTPLDETRDYVQQVLYNKVVYATRLQKPSPSLHTLLNTLSHSP